MASLKMTIKKKGKVVTGKAAEVVDNQLFALLTEMGLFLESQVKDRTPHGVFGNAGGLVSTIRAQPVKRTRAVMRTKIVHGKPQYGDVMERGRKTVPGQMPPKGTLVRWIVKKFGVDREEAEKIEFPIRRNIAKFGSPVGTKVGRFGSLDPGYHMFRDAVLENQQQIQAIADNAGFELSLELNQ